MKYPYPKLTNTLTFRRTSDEDVEITDHATGNQYSFPIWDAWYAKQLDGYTDPYAIADFFTREEVGEQLAFLQKYDLIRRKRLRSTSLGTWMLPLVIPKWTPRARRFARRWNLLLMLLWLPVFVLGTALFWVCEYHVEYGNIPGGFIIGFVLGLLSGLILHECGHAFAGVTYGGRVFEMGVMVMHFIAPGAYVLACDDTVKGRGQRIQLYAAGVETNFLLTGLFLGLAAMIPWAGDLFMIAGIDNLVLGLFNLLLIRGLDGARILSLLLGIEEPVLLAARVVRSRRVRQMLRTRGDHGYAVIGVCYVLRLMQFLLPLVYLMTVLEVASCF